MIKVSVVGANSKGQTALHLAARGRNLREVKRLLSLGVDVNARDKKDRTPLHLAASWNRNQTHYCTIQVLLENGADVDAKDDKNKTPFHYMVGRANVNVVKLLLNFKANINTWSISGDSLVGSAVCRRNTEVLRLLFDHSLDMKSSTSDSGLSLLHLAAVHNKGNSHLDTIKLLLENGADVNAQDKNGNTSLHMLFQNKSIFSGVKTIELFLNFGANINIENQDKQTFLTKAIYFNHVKAVQLIIDYGFDIKSMDRYGSTFLHLAANFSESNSYFNMFAVLLKNGFDANAQDKDGNTPLHLLVLDTISVEIVELFLKFNADVNIKNVNGKNPLFFAVFGDNFEMVQLLVDHGSDVNCVSNKKSTPLYEAFDYTDHNQVEIVKYLLKNGANVHAFDSGLEKLGNFIYTTNTSSLLKYADVSIVDSWGWNILDYADSIEDQNIILKQLAQLEFLGVSLHKEILETISESNEYNDYFKECIKELKIAKSIKLQNCWVTFFNLLVENKRKLKNYAGNEDLVQDFKRTDCLKKFPIYGEMIQKNMEKGIKTRKSFDESAVILSDYMPIFNPTHLIIRDTLDCLTFKDYLKLVKE